MLILADTVRMLQEKWNLTYIEELAIEYSANLQQEQQGEEWSGTTGTGIPQALLVKRVHLKRCS